MKFSGVIARAGSSRGLRHAAIAVAAALTAGLLPALPATADAGAGRPKVHDPDRVVRGHKLPVRARKPGSAASGGSAPAKIVWPAPGSADIAVPEHATPVAAAKQLTPTQVRAGHLPVWITAPEVSDSGQDEVARAVRVRMLDHGAAARTGIDGAVFTLARTDSAVRPGRVGVRLDYSGFAQAFGGSYGQRLRLVQLPACALSTPTRPQCRDATPLAARNNAVTKTLTADVDAAAANSAVATSSVTVLAATSGSSGPSGDYQATALSPSATWNVDTHTGDFTWSYPMRVPPVPGGLAPKVAVSYSSGSVDGRTANANGQPSWIGEGFDLWPGYIERGYKSCEDDGAPKDEWGNSPGDECWGYDNATITWNGKGGELIPAGSGQWRFKDDDGTRIERIADTTTGNGDNDGEYWKLTTVDGTQYYFGKNRLPGWTSGKPETKSTWTVPVYGDDAGEPCYKSSGFADSWCQQAWRWNLDYVVDPHGNAITYYYTPESNHYGRDLKPEDETQYERGGYLDHIEYGLRSDDLFAAAPALVKFDVAERCIPDSSVSCDPATIADHPYYWWDVPWDLHCDSGQDCTDDHGTVSPTFWTRKRLVKVTTQVIKSDGTYRDVDSWALTHTWGEADLDRDLLLHSIQHTGLAGGTPVTLPPVTFNPVQLPNRVDKQYDDIPTFIRYRVGAIYDESGGLLDVNYSTPDCTATDLPTPETNTRRCYPTYWQPAGHNDPIRDWFHKYVVTQVIRTDLTGYSPDMITDYDYQGGAAWHYDDDDGLTKEKNKTWSQWRGYGHVIVQSGGLQQMLAQSDHFYFRGMDGDRLDTSGGTKTVTVSDGEGGTYPDHESLDGFEVRTVTYDAPGGTIVAKTVNSPWHHQTASRTRSWGTVTADLTGVATTRTLTALDGGSWRETRTTKTFETTAGLTTHVDDAGDTSTATDDRCTTTSYAQNSAAWMLNFPSQVRTVALSCDKTPTDLSTQLISDARTYYDNGALGAAPTKGDATKAEVAASATASAVTYVAKAQTSYDAYGRPLTVTDAGSNTTTTTYTDTAGLTTKVEILSPAVLIGTTSTQLKTTQTLDAAWGSPLTQTDAGGKTTNLTYDALGRSAKVWLPDRTTAMVPTYEFTYQVEQNKIVAVATKKIKNDGGQATSWDLLDGWLRSRQTQAPGPDGGRLITDTLYNSLGKVARTNAAYYATGAPDSALFGIDTPGNVETQTRYGYDGLGRVTLERVLSGNADTPELWHTTTSYSGDRVTVDPPEGATPTTTVSDARGQVVELRQYKAPDPTGAYDSTAYTYTPAGQLASITGPDNSKWTYAYDLRGRKTSETDPDKGDSTYTYDDLDRLVTSQDARGKKLAYSYDALNRRTGEYNTSTTGAKIAEWTYDTVRKGQPASSTRYSGTNAYTTTINAYDPLNRATRTTITLPSSEGALAPAGGYQFTADYNADGTLRSTGFPAAGGLNAETVVYGYDDLSRPITLGAGLSSYVTGTDYSQTGKPLQYELWTSATTDKKAWLSFGYEWGTQRLNESRTERESITGVDRDAFYSYDQAGDVTAINDISRAGTDTQCFRYDYLRRLTDAWAQNGGACPIDPSTAVTGGPAPYRTGYTYTASGNRKTETGYAANGTVTATRGYGYTGDTGVDPAIKGHQLGAVTQTGTGAHTETYGYDADGNTTTRTIGATSQTLTWDIENHLTKVTQGTSSTSYFYDADGNELIRRDPGGTTLYLPGMELRLAAGATTPTATRYYTFSDTAVAMRTGAGVQYLSADHHGTAELAINATTQALAQRRYTPFGQVRATTGTWPAANDKGFLAGTNEPTGLTHLGARHYDPATGRFVSVDPLLDPADPQSLNGYTYADNNPTTSSDPSGQYKCSRSTCPGAPGSSQCKIHHDCLPDDQLGGDNPGGANCHITRGCHDPYLWNDPVTHQPMSPLANPWALGPQNPFLLPPPPTQPLPPPVKWAAAGAITVIGGTVCLAGACEAIGAAATEACMASISACIRVIGALTAAGEATNSANGAGDAPNILPNASDVHIDPRKVFEYALNPEHPVGGNKARVFLSALGFTRQNGDELVAQIRAGVRNTPATLGRADEYGQRYTVDVPVTGPKGSGVVRTGWIVRSGSSIPSLATLFVKVGD